MKILTGLLLILISFASYAGPTPPDNLSGESLRIWLKENWYNRKHQDLGYNIARRHMYGFIDKDSSGNVSGVYSGFTQRGGDTTFLDPINAEHTIPQSWFDRKSPMKSDCTPSAQVGQISLIA